jgi:hypothetical protein
MTWYTSTCSITAIGLLYRLDDMVECVCYMGLVSNRCFMASATLVECVCYMGLISNRCFMANIALTGGHYRMDIISGVGHPRSCWVMLLVLYTVVYNI